MNLEVLLDKPLPSVPPEIEAKLRAGQITLTSFEDRNVILSDADLQKEIGYRQFDDGSFLVSMTCPMPDITPEMIKWWFWWHPQEDIRYQIWFPNTHYRIGFGKKDSPYYLQAEMPTFRANTNYPTERIAGIKMPLRIDFITPESFGFSIHAMQETNIPLIVCGHVGAFGGIVMHTEMAHIFKKTDDGLFLISRFWLGKTIKSMRLRRAVMNEQLAYGMAEHCCIEYRNLVEILPDLYVESHPGSKNE